MVIPEAMIQAILEAPVTERAFVEQLHELNHKIQFEKEQRYKEARACDDVADVIDKLKRHAMAKIRDYLLEKISAFRRPLTNYQVDPDLTLYYVDDVN